MIEHKAYACEYCGLEFDEDEREKCLEYGMNDYLSKPILAKDLQEMIQKWVLIKD